MLHSFIHWLQSLKTRHKIVLGAVAAYFLFAKWIDENLLGKTASDWLRRHLVEFWNNISEPVSLPIYALGIAAVVALVSVVATALVGMFMYDRARQEIADLTSQLRTDDLTKIPNRRQIREMYAEKMKYLETDHSPFCLAYVDIVDFKKINSHVHHERADGILKDFAKIIESDIRKEDRIFRLAGDQFALLLHKTTPSQATKAAKRLNEMLRDNAFPVDLDPDTNVQISITVQCRFGITDCHVGEVVETCLMRADAALKIAKEELLSGAPEDEGGIRIVTREMALSNPRLIAAVPIVPLPKK